MPDRKPLTQHGFLELPVTRDLSETALAYSSEPARTYQSERSLTGQSQPWRT